MAAKSREEIIRFYDDLCRESGHSYAEGMRLFLPQLFGERELAGCTFFTSHATLCVVRYPTYPEWVGKPAIDIISTAPNRIQIEFTVTTSSDPVHRTLTEAVNCPIDLALAEFDLMYGRFLAAHEVPPSGGGEVEPANALDESASRR
jgi:hypothetical protein